MKPRVIFLAVAALATANAATAADATHGKALYVQCAACHSIADDKATLGPPLKGVVGRKAGDIEAYVYSPAMRRSTAVWTPETLDAFLADPQAVVAGSKMPFAGLPAASDRADLIAYLADPTAAK